MRDNIRIEKLDVSAYAIPTADRESDGTHERSSTTMILVRLHGGGKEGIGWTYAHEAAALLIRDRLESIVEGCDAMAIPRAWWSMQDALRDLGRPGLGMMAVSAVDVAMWDLQARLVEMPLGRLLGMVRPAIAVYGSGGFTSYSIDRLQEQLAGWVSQGIARVKMKVGRQPAHDVERVRAARTAIGDEAELFVDANGAYSRKQALAMAEEFHGERVSWFEEPVSSDDLDGLRLIRDRAPVGMQIAAGEYGWDPPYFRRMLESGAVDVLQPDATRCGGITGFLRANTLAHAFNIPISAHTAPTIHLHACCAAETAIHLEYYFDHVRIEQMLFDGAPTPDEGLLEVDCSRHGLGVEFKEDDAEEYRVA